MCYLACVLCLSSITDRELWFLAFEADIHHRLLDLKRIPLRNDIKKLVDIANLIQKKKIHLLIEQKWLLA